MWNDNLGWFWTGDKYAPDVYLNDFARWYAFSSDPYNVFLTWPVYDQVEQKWLNEDEFSGTKIELAKETIATDITNLSEVQEIISI